MSVQNRRKYDSDFKRNAVLLSEEPGRTVSEVAENLGVNRELIYRWRRTLEPPLLGHSKFIMLNKRSQV